MNMLKWIVDIHFVKQQPKEFILVVDDPHKSPTPEYTRLGGKRGIIFKTGFAVPC